MAADLKIERFGSLVGGSPQMRQVYALITKAAQVNVPVLIVGETGTGKELVAKEIHDRGPRKKAPFVAVNTGALSEDLAASELFGHLKGSYTGAFEDYDGRFGEACGGSLFLDEISTMVERVQVVFLRVLDCGLCRPIGAKRPKKVDVRVIAATNTDLREAVEKGCFREDLLQRLTVFRIVLPPLREHLEDFRMLAYHFLESSRDELDVKVIGIAESTFETLLKYPWPGNVRELKNAIWQSAIVAGKGAILPRHIPLRITAFLERGDHVLPERAAAVSTASRETLNIPMGLPLIEVRKAYVLKTLARQAFNKVRAAKSLGISRKTLHQWLTNWGIDNPDEAKAP
jgi:DNA-binding NtrC family response regulator